MHLSHAWIANVSSPYCMRLYVTQKGVSLELMLDVAITHTDTDTHIQSRLVTYTDVDHSAA